MKFSYTNLHVGEPFGPTLAERLIEIEADLAIRDGKQLIFTDTNFPIGELAYHLSTWLTTPGERHGFVLDTMSTDPGWVLIEEREEGWTVGSIMEPGVWSTPTSWEKLSSEIRRFVRCVRTDIGLMGADPDCIPDPEGNVL
ncbi:hypothetical protein AB0M57_31850 [Streptomyces sp. NPDC051597]|uniref:DUF7878 domain-containing protein n=1 Tax=Streptomyces sp. NPDC051597 TaxID=3155049 RepID=UPI0034236B0F